MKLFGPKVTLARFFCKFADMGKVTFRAATIVDVPLVAACVLAAVDLADLSQPVTEENTREYAVAKRVCSREDTLFSYRNARIICCDGSPIGAIVSYDGAIYQHSREITFRVFREELGNNNESYGVETQPGEYYLDSMAIFPEYRGKGIGLMAMQDSIDVAVSKGFHDVTLLVDSSAPQKEAYYARLGFRPIGRVQTFGAEFTKMLLSV